MPRPSEQAKKSIIKADPTVDENGICRGWEIEVCYALDGYKSSYKCQLEDGELDDKPPARFTRKELWSLCPVARWNMIFDSQYESVMNAPSAPKRQKVDNFDVKSLAAK